MLWLLALGGGVYGCLFSVPVQVERVCQVQRGFVERQSVVGCPEVQSVSLTLASGVKAVKGILAQVDGQRTLPAVTIMEGTATTQLRCPAAQIIEQAQVSEYLLQGDLLAKESEINLGVRRRRRKVRGGVGVDAARRGFYAGRCRGDHLLS